MSRERQISFDIHCTLALAYAQGKQDLSLKGLGASELGVVTVPYSQRHLIGECVAPETLVLTPDLHWRPVSELLEGDEVLAFDERPLPQQRRRFRRAVVQAIRDFEVPRIRIVTDKGSVICSQGHRWLTYHHSRSELRIWRPAKALFEGDRIALCTGPWPEDRSYSSGYIAAAWDGEGHINKNPGHWRLSFAQRPNAMAREVEQHLARKGFHYTKREGKDGLVYLSVGIRNEMLRLLGQCRPARLLHEYAALPPESHEATGSPATILSLEPLPPGPVIGLQTSTGTFIANGFYSHNSQYLAQDLFLTRDLLKKLLPLNHGTAYDIDRALIPALIDCSYRGYEVDQERLEGAIVKAEITRSRMEDAFGRMTEGVEVLHSRRKRTRKSGVDYVEKHGPPSIGSVAQLGRLLDLPDTNKETLMAVAAGGGNPGILADLVLRWRKASKALTTYFYPLQGKDRLTGLFNITPNEDMEGGTGTGRLSSERFNMQNQPPAVQRCLRAPEGYLLRQGDYPQIELRCAAEISDDPTMLAALSDPERDLHQETADRLFGGDRPRGKQFNFKELYIAGPAVKAAYPRFYEWAQEHWAEVQRTSYSVSPEPFLHRRFIPLLATGEHARMAAINHPVQSMAVYLTKIAMAELFREGALLVNQVHDSIHDYVPADCDRGLMARNMASAMESVMREYLPRVGNVPVEVKISRYWGDA